MNCDEFNKRLDNYASLTDEELSEMEKHSFECENCKKELDFMRSMMSVLNTLPDIEAPADFMEKLNARIDDEERKKNIKERIIRNIRGNWQRYTAAAACFALVAVVTSNGRLLVDKLDGSDGVITETPVVSGDTTPVPTAEALVLSEQTSGNEVTEEKTYTFSNNTVSEVNTYTDVKSETSKSVSAPKSNSEKTVTSNKNTTPSSTVTPASPIAEKEVDVTVEVGEVNENSDADTGIALMSEDEPHIANVRSVRPHRMPEVTEAPNTDAIEDYSLASGGRIAYGRYYKLDKDGNPIEDKEEKKPIGSIVVAAKDVDEAINVIRQYSYDEDGEFYTTSSDRLTSMLSVLSGQGIDYSNYTPAYEGEVTFKLVIS